MSEPDAGAKRSRASAARRQELVAGAFQLVAERGFEGLRTRDVAARAGVNIATFHYYFPTKEAVIGAVVEAAMIRFRTTLEPHGSPADQLRNHLRAVRNLLRREPEVGLVMGELALRSARDPSIGSLTGATNDTWFQLIRGLLRQAVKAGQLQPEVDTEPVAALVMLTMAAMSLPTMSENRGDLALQQLEVWLGLS